MIEYEKFPYNLGILFRQVSNENHYKIAIKYNDSSSKTYKELNELSSKIASWLIKKDLKKNDVVCIFNDKSYLPYAIMLACLKVGITYSNVDTTSPKQRIEKILSIANPRLIFYYEGFFEIIDDLIDDHVFEFCNYNSNDFLDTVDSHELFLDYSSVDGNTPAYLMFTSGSTGFPKGVVISHQNVLNFISWGKTFIGCSEQDVFTNINPMHFDNSVFDFYMSLFSGGMLVPIQEKLTKNPRHMIKYIEQMECSVWFSVPSMLVYVLRMRAIEESDLPKMKKIIFGGEGFPKNHLRTLFNLVGNRIKLINVYGPTECTCICSSYIVSENDLDNNDLLPLGPIAPNFKQLITNDELDSVKDGEIGELIIGGPNVGLGYYQNEEKTNLSFIQNPRHNAYRDVMYRSGDMVRFDLESNLLHFSGRKDNQIKRMGYRIELEEIEAALNSLSEIDESVCIHVRSGDRIVILACICCRIQQEEIKEKLRTIIPNYMMPDKFIKYDSLPKNQNGKIDRVALKEEAVK